MILTPLNKEMPVELVVSESGNVSVFHKGRIAHDYSWVQFDQYANAIQFITKEGETQDLGMKIHKPFHAALKKAREVFLIEVHADNSIGMPYLIKFSDLVE